MHVRVELQIASLTPACVRRVAKAATLMGSALRAGCVPKMLWVCDDAAV
jgi:hypothetical protein